MQNKSTVVLTDDKFQEIYTDESFRNQVASAHWQCAANGEKRCQITCSYPVTYIVTPEQIKTAEVERARAKKAAIANVRDKLVFVGMGCTYDARYEDDVCNFRIRTEFVGADGREFFVEFSQVRNSYIHVDFAIDRTRQKELKDSFERQGEFYNYKKLESSGKGSSTQYTLQNILKFVNENFGCNFREIEIDNYNLITEDYKSISPSFPYLLDVIKYADIKEEMTDSEIKFLTRAVVRTFPNLHTVKDAEEYFGLPYTSSSAFAGIWNTNVEHRFKQGTVQGFAILKDGRSLMLIQDADENDFWYCIAH